MQNDINVSPQGSVETLFRWGGKRSHNFAANFLGNGAPNYIKIGQFYTRYCIKTFWSTFCWIQCTIYIVQYRARQQMHIISNLLMQKGTLAT